MPLVREWVKGRGPCGVLLRTVGYLMATNGPSCGARRVVELIIRNGVPQNSVGL